MGNKEDTYYINKSLSEIDILIQYTQNKSYEEFVGNIQVLDATMFRLIQLIEQIKNLSSSFKEKHSEIPWGDILGFRNGIVHDYGKTDYSTVYEIVSKDIYQLKDVFEKEKK